MIEPRASHTLDSGVRLILGAGVTILTGILSWGPGAFARGQMYFSVSIGITGALVYIVCRLWGIRFAVGAAVLLSMLNAALEGQHYAATWSSTLVSLLLVALLWYALTTWKIERPAIGRLLLLGPLLALGSFFLTLILRLAFFPEYIFEASKNNATHYFKLGVGLGLGLELAELVIKWWHRGSVPSAGEVEKT